MKLTKKKAIGYLKKALVGSRKGFVETKKFVQIYGPKVNQASERIASSIQNSFTVNQNPNAVRPNFRPRPFRPMRPAMVQRPSRNDVYVKILPNGQRKLVRVKRRIQNRRGVDWNGLGVDF